MTVAQLDRAFGYEPKGQGFESLRSRHGNKPDIRAYFILEGIASLDPSGNAGAFGLRYAP